MLDRGADIPNLLTPNEDGLLPNVDGLLLNADGLLPKVDGLLPKVDGLLPNVDGLLPNEDALFPKLEVGAEPNKLLCVFEPNPDVWPNIDVPVLL